MSEGASSGEEQIDESGRNPTQQRMEEEGTEPRPADASWDDSSWGTTDAPHEGEEGQAGDVA